MKITTFNRVYIFLDIEKVQKRSRFRFQIIQHCYTLEYGKKQKQQLNGFIMDKMLYVADKQAYNQTSSQNFKFDENLFEQFMSKNPLWDYHCHKRSIFKNLNLRRSNFFQRITLI